MKRSSQRPVARERPGRPRAQDVDCHIGAMIRERRHMLGLTQQQLAEKIGVTYQQVCRYETSINRITAGRLYQIAQALGVEIGYFFQELESGQPSKPTAAQRATIEIARDLDRLPDEHGRQTLYDLARMLAEREPVTRLNGSGPSGEG